MLGWRTVPLGEVVTFQRGFDLPQRLRQQGRVPIVTSAGITDYHNSSMVEPPGVVTGRYGTIGEIFYITEPFWPLNTTLYVRNFHGNDPCFVYYLLQRFDFGSFSGKSGVPGVNRNDLHREPVTLPSGINEQRGIATALSDVDALLDGLDQLIAKKRDIKQAAMHQLLTGKTRLPGFEGEWHEKRLSDIGNFLKGTGIKKDESKSGMIPCVRYGELYTKHHEYIKSYYSFITPDIAKKSRLLQRGDILFAGSGETKEEIGKCAVFLDDFEAYAGGDIVIFRPEGIDSLFLGFFLNSPPVTHQKASSLSDLRGHLWRESGRVISGRPRNGLKK